MNLDAFGFTQLLYILLGVLATLLVLTLLFVFLIFKK